MDTYVLAVQDLMTNEVSNQIDWEGLRADIQVIIPMMDDTIDANEFVPARGHNPGVPQIKEVTLQTRKLGLGIMGMARMLFKMGLAYNSREGRALCQRVYAFIDLVSKEVSVELAMQRGMFPYMQTNREEVTQFYIRDWTERAENAKQDGMDDIAWGYTTLIDLMVLHGMRNSTTTTVAPTGTISMLHDTSGGCEPQFALVISRNQAGVKMHEADKVFARELQSRYFSDHQIEKIFEIVGQHRGSLAEALYSGDLNGPAGDRLHLLLEMVKIYVVAGDISPEDHVRMQACLQRYCDSAISKTVNFPKEATEEQVAEVYRLAIETGCKGVTVYRDGCRAFQPLTAGNRESGEVVAAKDQEIAKLKALVAQYEQISSSVMGHIHMDGDKLTLRSGDRPQEPRHRANRLYGFNERIQTGDGKLYATVGYDDEGIREVVVEVGKAGGVLNGLVEALGRLISLSLKYRVPVRVIAGMLRGIRSANPHGWGDNQILSIPDGIGKLLEEAPATLMASASDEVSGISPEHNCDHAPEPEPAASAPVRAKPRDWGESPECPQCSSPMKMGEGCKGGTCTNPECGFAKC